MRRKWHIVGYDIRDPKRLRRVSKLLLGYGDRIQYSLFRVLASERQLERLRWELSRITEEEDDLLIVGLCHRCAAGVIEVSEKQTWDADPPNFAVIGGFFKEESVFEEKRAS